jgi:hypothetical protein
MAVRGATMPILKVERPICIWDFVVSHSQLLLRATKDQAHPTRLDVAFGGVAAVNLPVFMSGVTIDEADPSLRDEILRATHVDVPEERRVFLVEGPDFKGWVIAGILSFVEDDGEYDDPSSILSPSR